MYYLKFFVPCTGWATGGYENVQYFETAEDAKRWAAAKKVKILELKKVPDSAFAEDYIGSL